MSRCKLVDVHHESSLLALLHGFPLRAYPLFGGRSTRHREERWICECLSEQQIVSKDDVSCSMALLTVLVESLLRDEGLLEKSGLGVRSLPHVKK